jgi:hypothetical protein
MMGWSVALGLLGVATTGLVAARLRRTLDRFGPQAYWGVGLGALFPAWLVVFVSLLGGVSLEPGLANRLWVLSSAAGLLGVILTDGVTRRLHAGGLRPPATYWLLGVVALLPAWLVALLGLR